MTTVLVVLATVFAATPAAIADTAPPNAALPETVSNDSLPTAQINGVAWDQVVVGNTVYVGGSFATARPAGAAAGTNTVARSNILAYNITTGALTTFAPVLNGQVRSLDTSPDGTRLYVAGAFTAVNGVTRNRVAAFNTANGALITTFAPSVNGQVYGITATNSTVYFAGQFSAVGATQRTGQAAAATAATGAITSWAPIVSGGRPFALEVAPDGSKVVIAGNFTALNGSSDPGYGMGAVDTASGASVPWAVGSLIRNAGSEAAIYSLNQDADSLYGTGYVYPFPTTRVTTSNFEGAFRASWATGDLEWVADCRGDEYSIASVAGAVYIAGHAHDCAPLGGFPQTRPSFWYRGEAFSKEVTQVSRGQFFAGQPAPALLHFFPTFNTGSYTGQFQGPWSVEGNANYVVYAGEFTTVNGVAQQGLSRFALDPIAPNDDGPRESAAAWPLTATPSASGTVRLAWPTNHDRDNELLTYRLIRNGNTGSPIFTTTARSSFWDRSNLGYVDSGLTPGATYTYRVSATDPFGNVAQTSTITTTAGTGGTLSPYARTVLTDNPTFYFRLSEPSGPSINWAGQVGATGDTGVATQVVDATVGSTAVRELAGAIASDPDTSMRFDNTDTSRTYTTVRTFGDDSLSVEAWFRTTTSSGKIVGFGDSATATNSRTFDRSIYLNEGRVTWGVNDGAERALQSGEGYDNGTWHHVVGSVGESGMTLYVDGQLVGTRVETIKARPFWGYWHIGGDTVLAGNPNFTGDIDEVAVYKVPLTATEIAQHYQLGGVPPVNIAPTASFTVTSIDLTASVDAGASSDDGSIVSYEWDFGDGGEETGVTASHEYATEGTYTVTLTVTDDEGETDTTTRIVTVAESPNTPPTASFTTSVTGLAAAVNASASTDADGEIDSYAWDFGDGATGTGVSTSHSYATANTYTITLTVTDDEGATASTTRSVTVTAVPVVTVLAQDAFGRTTTSGWGTADIGGAWSAAANTSYVVNSGSAAAIHTVGTTRRALLTGISTTATNILVDVSIDKAATGGGVSVGAVGRQVGTSFYQARVRFITGGTIGLQILNGSSTVLANLTTVPGLSYTPGQQLRLRVQTTGTNPTTITAKVWAVGTTEPATWTLSTTDTTATLQAAGSVGVESYLSGSATNAPLTVRYDNYLVTTP